MPMILDLKFLQIQNQIYLAKLVQLAQLASELRVQKYLI